MHNQKLIKNHASKIKNLQTVFDKKYFSIFNGLGIYYWIAGGAIRDFFAQEKPKDLDFY